VVVAVNNGTSSQEVQVSLPMDNFSGSAQPYLTDSNDNGAAQRPIAVSSGSFSATVPAGSVVSFVITRSGESIGGPRTASRSPR
jgi:glucuronoarabinoxylan endo-1,4-beta-xylanase